jgi:hypothetical protein
MTASPKAFGLSSRTRNASDGRSIIPEVILFENWRKESTVTHHVTAQLFAVRTFWNRTRPWSFGLAAVTPFSLPVQNMHVRTSMCFGLQKMIVR